MKTINFFEWCQQNNIKVPQGNHLNGEWFFRVGLPMIVKCKCCDSSMSLPSAFIDEKGSVYCSNCKD